MNYQNILIAKDTEKRDLISGCSCKNREILVLFDENPYDYLSDDISVQKIEENKYLIQPPYIYEELSKWLHYGNWQAISPAISSYEFIDSFRTSSEVVRKHLTNHKIELMVDSFHDDIEWNVFRKG